MHKTVISYEGPLITELEGGLRYSGWTPARSIAPSGTPPQKTRGDMMGRRLEQRRVQMKSLVADLITEDSDRKGQWQNCGSLDYTLRTPNTGPESCPPLIGTMFTDGRATVVLGGYEGVILNEVGMTMELVGPGDVERLRETCRVIVTENNTVSDVRTSISRSCNQILSTVTR